MDNDNNGGVCFYLNRVGNVDTLLHTRNVELDHPQVFAFDYDGSQRSYKSGTQVQGFINKATIQRLSVGTVL